MDQNQTFSFENLSIDDLKNVMVKIYKGTSDQEVIQATLFLRAYALTIESIPVFVQLLTQERTPELRLLSAIILRKFIGNHLLAMEEGDVEVLRRGILTRFFEEPLQRVQRTLAVLISVMLESSFQNEKGWTEPLILVSEKSKAEQPEEVRVQAFLLLSTILEFAGSYLSDFYEEFFKFFLETIKDKSSTIRKHTLLCVLNMYTTVSQQSLIASFQEIYPLLLESFYHSLQERDDDTIEKVLEVLETLTHNKNILFDNEKLTKLVEVFCTNDALLCKDLSTLYRARMIDILQNVTLSYKTVISKNEAILKKVIEVVFTLACYKEAPEEIGDKDSLQEVALFYINHLGVLLPKKRSYKLFKEYLQTMFASDNENVIEGAFYILGNLVEGCREYFRRELEQIVHNYLQKGLESSSKGIKKATFYAINYCTNYLSPEFFVYHQILLPSLIRNISETSDQKLLQKNVTSLEIFCQEMDENIMTYLPEIIPRLIALIDKPEIDIPVKRHAILAISACSEVAQERFVPYANDLIPLLALLVKLEDVKLVELKATATKCIGIILENSLKQNPELFRTHIEPLIQLIYEGIKTTEDSLLKEFSFEFFYRLAAYLQQDFRIYLEQVLELLFLSAEHAKSIQVEEKKQVVSLLKDADGDDDEDNPNNFYYDEEAMQELAVAIRCLGEMALACPADFRQYFEKTVALIAESSDHAHLDVRLQSLICYKNLIISLVKYANNGQLPKPKHGLPCTDRLPSEAEEFLYIEVYNKFINAVETDDNVQVLITVMECIYDFCTELGPAAVDQRIEELLLLINKILVNETEAQTIAFDEDEEVHGELFSSATLTLHSIIKVCRDGFLPYFPKVFSVLKKFVNEETPDDDVAEVIGCLGQAIKYMPSAGSNFGLEILDLCFKAIDNGDEYTNRNAGFCIGMAVEFAKEKVYDHYSAIMQKLKEILETSTLQDTRDNAVGALGRMVFTNPSLVPLNIVVPGIVKEMPLKGDLKEERTLVKMLIFLFETNVQALSGMEEKCIELLIDAVIERNTYKIKDENVIKAIGKILKNLSENQNAKQIIQNVASKLSQENVEILTQLLSAQY